MHVLHAATAPSPFSPDTASSGRAVRGRTWPCSRAVSRWARALLSTAASLPSLRVPREWTRFQVPRGRRRSRPVAASQAAVAAAAHASHGSPTPARRPPGAAGCVAAALLAVLGGHFQLGQRERANASSALQSDRGCGFVRHDCCLAWHRVGVVSDVLVVTCLGLRVLCGVRASRACLWMEACAAAPEDRLNLGAVCGMSPWEI